MRAHVAPHLPRLSVLGFAARLIVPVLHARKLARLLRQQGFSPQHDLVALMLRRLKLAQHGLNGDP